MLRRRPEEIREIADESRAASGSRTRDLELGKLALYQLSYRRVAQIVRDRLYPL
jgi:hypothetical protein